MTRVPAIPDRRTSRESTHTLVLGPLALVLLALGIGLLPGCGDGSPRPALRHVILLTLDTTRADHLGCYGNPAVQTPALDQLAREGVRFQSCTAAASTTLASHASIMTGTYPHRHGVPRNGFVLSEQAGTLAEVLEMKGFWCAGFLGSAALVKRTGLDQGFLHWDEEFDEAVEPGGNDQSQRDAAAVTDRILEHVGEILGMDDSEEARLMVFGQYFDPHAPYAPPAAEVERYGADFPVGGFGQIESAVVEQQTRALGASAGGQQGVITKGLSEELLRGAARVPTGTGRQLARLYAGEVSHMDREIGRLLLGLDALGVLEESLVVVTADHGETFWDGANAWNHGLWVGEPEVSVPLIVRAPLGSGVVRGGVIETPVSGVDIMPTVLEILGLEGPAGLDGRSLAGVLTGELGLKPLPVFCEATQPGRAVETEGLRWFGDRKPSAVRSGRWKFISAGYLGLEMLFDLEADPGETRDLLATAPEAATLQKAEELRAALQAWRASARPLPTSFDRQQAKGLASLGYAEADEKGR